MCTAQSSAPPLLVPRSSRRNLLSRGLLGLAGLMVGGAAAGADNAELRIAVASNFRPVLDLLIERHAPTWMPATSLSSASTGVLYQQIRFGAPFDLFLAADQHRPQSLYEAGIGQQPQLYCRGLLALVSQHGLSTSAPLQKPKIASSHRVALADPKLAPYGVAANALLRQWGVDNKQHLLATNTAQALQWFAQGRADWALLPLSLVKQAKLEHLTIAPQHHPAIDQYSQRLTNSIHARQFEQWLLSADTQRIIARQGYADLRGQQAAGERSS